KVPTRLSMLTALDMTDPANHATAIEQLCQTLQHPAPGSAPKPPCPYPGMVPFGEVDSSRFYGRDREIQELVEEHLWLHPFVAVIGRSGSGKSSLVSAGLLPALRQSRLFRDETWMVRMVRPGEAPQVALATALGGDIADVVRAVEATLATESDARRLLLIVDQFEEIFTVARTDAALFQEALFQ